MAAPINTDKPPSIGTEVPGGVGNGGGPQRPIVAVATITQSVTAILSWNRFIK